MNNLSVILVSYNTKEITSECLKRLKISIDHCEKTLNNKIETIVVDNDSQDGSIETVKKDFPWVRLVETGENRGYGVGNNLGMKIATGDYFLLLNTDAYVEKNTLEKSLNFFKDNSEADVLGSKLTYKNGSLQPNAGYLPTPLKTTVWLLGFESLPGVSEIFPSVHKRNKSYYSFIQNPEWVMGAFFMLKKAVFTNTGGFDEAIFMYMEEVEWCIRLKIHGFKVFYTPDFSVVHLGGASSGFNLAVPLFKEMEGLSYIYKKHFPAWLWLLRLLIFFGSLMRIIAFTFLGKFKRVKAYIKVLATIL